MTDDASTRVLDQIVPRDILDTVVLDDEERVVYPRELAGLTVADIAEHPALVSLLIASAETLA